MDLDCAHRMNLIGDTLAKAVADLPRRYPGPGGAAAVVREGIVLERHAWGWANAEERIPFSSTTPFRICSITKQFVCALALSCFHDLSELDGDIRGYLPHLEQSCPTMLQLCHNQSGLRDYWALAMLHGSPIEGYFDEDSATRLIGEGRTLQFSPGTRYSYANQNFRILSNVLQARLEGDLDGLLRRQVFHRAGMATAQLGADTASPIGGTTGYEGSLETGFRPAVNRITWTGDAGLVATLDDLIAWERSIDQTRNDPESIYRRLATPVSFRDGTPAAYGFGLSHRSAFGRPMTGHSGALRGWRSHRLYIPSERLSVVVFFNHMADPFKAALDLVAAAIGEVTFGTIPSAQTPSWLGTYLEPETRTVIRLDQTPDRRIRSRMGHLSEELDVQPDGSAAGAGVRLRCESEGLRMDRLYENQSSLLVRCERSKSLEVTGRYHCDELETGMAILGSADATYAVLSGKLGEGRLELLEPVGNDNWLLPCPRALDHPAPGSWTISPLTEAHGRIQTLTLGCPLARRLTYRRLD